MNDSSQRGQEQRLQPTCSVQQALNVDVTSFVTQVTSRPGPSPTTSQKQLELQASQSWGARVRSLFCCFASERGGYFKAEGERRVPPRVRGQVLVGPKRPEDMDKKTLVLDLDETLVHASFKPVPNADYIIPVDVDGKTVEVYVIKRPWLEHFMASVAENYEVIVFTASLSKYADPLLDLMDKSKVIRWRLFRESCCTYEGNYVKDLSCLGRDLADTIIVDNSPHSYVFQPQNAMPIGTFIDDMDDRELLDMLPLLAMVEKVDDVRLHLESITQQNYL